MSSAAFSKRGGDPNYTTVNLKGTIDITKGMADSSNIT
eukprot:CAMPEP_0178533148 /NCGR_PEP_ID=MMETSP0696-20121128/34342_1 /TAXON_ID=265572 /ORGANISM="Extubocellulus spinifer, Strain CCMP396" /LENGTH=37 /DNA_ID= /DNA_START= /DNA_END= /DNA_ORIENTATION=